MIGREKESDSFGQQPPWPRILVELSMAQILEEEVARGTCIVGIQDRGSIVANANEGGRIATGGLAGCTAVAIVLRKADMREGYIQHYSPRLGIVGVGELTDFLDARKAALYDSARAVITTPGVEDWSVLSQDLKPEDGELAGQLIQVAQHGLPEASDIKVLAYQLTLRTLLVELAEDGTDRIYAETSLV